MNGFNSSDKLVTRCNEHYDFINNSKVDFYSRWLNYKTMKLRGNTDEESRHHPSTHTWAGQLTLANVCMWQRFRKLDLPLSTESDQFQKVVSHPFRFHGNKGCIFPVILSATVPEAKTRNATNTWRHHINTGLPLHGKAFPKTSTLPLWIYGRPICEPVDRASGQQWPPEHMSNCTVWSHHHYHHLHNRHHIIVSVINVASHDE